MAGSRWIQVSSCTSIQFPFIVSWIGCIMCGCSSTVPGPSSSGLPLTRRATLRAPRKRESAKHSRRVKGMPTIPTAGLPLTRNAAKGSQLCDWEISNHAVNRFAPRAAVLQRSLPFAGLLQRLVLLEVDQVNRAPPCRRRHSTSCMPVKALQEVVRDAVVEIAVRTT